MKTIAMLILFVSPLVAEIGFVRPWGKDRELGSNKPFPPTDCRKKNGVMVRLSESVIFFHQRIISPANGPRSHFSPTSSQYMLLAIRRHGFIKGYIMGCDRLLRENREEWVYRKVIIDGEEIKRDFI
ncbi:MAG: membrane protein insertion efficiency factor YidD [Chlamydiota bacterium]